METRGYWEFKEEALDRSLWRTRYRRGYGPVIRQAGWWWRWWFLMVTAIDCKPLPAHRVTWLNFRMVIFSASFNVPVLFKHSVSDSVSWHLPLERATASSVLRKSLHQNEVAVMHARNSGVCFYSDCTVIACRQLTQKRTLTQN